MQSMNLNYFINSISNDHNTLLDTWFSVFFSFYNFSSSSPHTPALGENQETSHLFSVLSHRNTHAHYSRYINQLYEKINSIFMNGNGDCLLCSVHQSPIASPPLPLLCLKVGSELGCLFVVWETTSPSPTNYVLFVLIFQ